MKTIKKCAKNKRFVCVCVSRFFSMADVCQLQGKMIKPIPDLPLYIKADPKTVVCVRARLRLGVALTPSACTSIVTSIVLFALAVVSRAMRGIFL